jgi:hypothetical protein
MIQATKLGVLPGHGAAIWYEIAGYTTHVKELSALFNINFVTLRNRLASGWHVAPACMAANTEKMSLKETTACATSAAFDEMFSTKLRQHMGRPSLAMFKV